MAKKSKTNEELSESEEEIIKDPDLKASTTKRMKKLSRILSSCHSPLRLSILEQLHQNGEVSMQDLIETAGTSQPAVSHHVTLLKNADLIDDVQYGRRRSYHLTERGTKLMEVVSVIDQIDV